MRASAVFAAAALLAAALPANLRAASAVLEFDSKFPPPALCLQQFIGLHDSVGRMGGDGGAGPMDASSSAWALRARSLKAGASPADWSRLEGAWDRYVSARASAARALDRTCLGEQLATSFGFDLVYVIAAPFEIIGAVSPDENGKTTPSVALLPVAGAVGLASDSVFTAALPFATLSAKLRARRADRAFKRFTDLVVELEKAGPPGRKGG